LLTGTKKKGKTPMQFSLNHLKKEQRTATVLI